jgi:hypothetical protein
MKVPICLLLNITLQRMTMSRKVNLRNEVSNFEPFVLLLSKSMRNFEKIKIYYNILIITRGVFVQGS